MINSPSFIFLFALFSTPCNGKYKIVVTKISGTGFEPVKRHSQDGCATKSVNYFLASVKDAINSIYRRKCHAQKK
jgi:hypothetical protein